mmetsp:Transcript_24064/g.54866  ORF Transcript_24064/g.54866 Transcript_24064/m.54866 type:complete len:231 (+) Transcript_24064:74-766(+)
MTTSPSVREILHRRLMRHHWSCAHLTCEDCIAPGVKANACKGGRWAADMLRTAVREGRVHEYAPRLRVSHDERMWEAMSPKMGATGVRNVTAQVIARKQSAARAQQGVSPSSELDILTLPPRLMRTPAGQTCVAQAARRVASAPAGPRHGGEPALSLAESLRVLDLRPEHAGGAEDLRGLVQRVGNCPVKANRQRSSSGSSPWKSDPVGRASGAYFPASPVRFQRAPMDI